MPVPLIIAGAGLMTLGGLAAVTHEASKIGFSSSSGSGDDEWGNTSYEDKIREYESIAIGGEFDDEEKKRGNNQGAAVGATAGASVGVAAIEASKGCQDCPAIPYIVPHQNDITNTRTPNAYAYQARICNTQIRTVDTPAGQMRYIDEWKCTIPVPTRTLNPLVEFDGWKPDECNFIETKDNYEFFFNSKGEPNWFMNEHSKILKQAGEQNWLCYSQFKKRSFIDWHFSHKKMYDLCEELLEQFSQVRTHYSP